MNNHNYLLDKCIDSKGTHYDISLYIYEKIKNIYKYTNENQWLYFDNNIWNIDINLNYITNIIKSIIVNDFITRSLYWDNFNDCSIKSIRLLEIANKLKNNKFIKDIIKELKQFYL